MKKAIFLLLALSIVLSGCASESGPDSKGLSPGDMLDVDTGTIFSLGDPREKFDTAFSYMGTEESDTEDGTEVEYLGGVLSVIFSDGSAIEIECDGGTNRFEFYGFTFDTKLEDIVGRYKLLNAAGYDFYSRYFDQDGKDTNVSNAEIRHTLMVRVGDLLDMKDGQYLHYTISIPSHSL